MRMQPIVLVVGGAGYIGFAHLQTPGGERHAADHVR
jgi:hypothetical protein